MNLFFTLLIFVLGLVIGSFLNCLIYRLETGGNFSKGRSFCPHCKHTLSWQDLIPVFSFLFLKGKCRYCGKPISFQYPLVEIFTGFLFVFIFNFVFKIQLFNFENILNLLFLIVISCFLIVIFVFDLKHFIIPDKVVYPAIIFAIIYSIFYFIFVIGDSGLLIQYSISAFLAAAFFLLIVLVSRGRWMGIGDIKLAFLMGLFLGWPNILTALFLAFFIGAIIGLGLIVLKRKTLKSEVPFGPFLVAGTFLALFWGEKMLDWYLNLFLLK
ncbi:MAG: prepilin peptidase [Candidatus Pacebacteria bacterium]|nr:prepilin peptidase [Candidatus Paceibacterota bacterium]